MGATSPLVLPLTASNFFGFGRSIPSKPVPCRERRGRTSPSGPPTVRTSHFLLAPSFPRLPSPAAFHKLCAICQDLILAEEHGAGTGLLSSQWLGFIRYRR